MWEENRLSCLLMDCSGILTHVRRGSWSMIFIGFISSCLQSGTIRESNKVVILPVWDTRKKMRRTRSFPPVTRRSDISGMNYCSGCDVLCVKGIIEDFHYPLMAIGQIILVADQFVSSVKKVLYRGVHNSSMCGTLCGRYYRGFPPPTCPLVAIG